MWFLRVLGIWSLLAAMVALTVDGTRSLAGQGQFIVTKLGEHWFKLHSASLNTFQASVERHVHPVLWDPVIINVLQIPTWIFFTVLGLLLYWIGRRKKPREIYTN
ncbi:MAG: hypothetical protein OEM91_02740 [Hyphomicrobiales bacterium]|nr:hypothetical protein [Hyphomicrobiales bacterium]